MDHVRKAIKLGNNREILIRLSYGVEKDGYDTIPTEEEGKIIDNMHERIAEVIEDIQVKVSETKEAARYEFNRGYLTASLNFLVDNVIYGNPTGHNDKNRSDITLMVAAGLTYPYFSGDHQKEVMEQWLFNSEEEFKKCYNASATFNGTISEHCAQTIIDRVNDVYVNSVYMSDALNDGSPLVLSYRYPYVNDKGQSFTRLEHISLTAYPSNK